MATLSDFTYHLPPQLIAQTPVKPRDHARLMLINRATGEISHHHIYDLPHLLPPSYFLVANNTKVFPARLLGNKATGGKLELLLLSKLTGNSYTAITKPGLDLHDTCFLSPTLQATVTKVDGYLRTLLFSQSDPILTVTLATLGTMPTPPYIKQLLKDPLAYQTIYAKYGFSAAAPTAGLHFTPRLLQSLKLHHPWLELTLNVGLGTFLPVKVNDLTTHRMHTESYTLTAPTVAKIQQLKNSSHSLKLLAIGTTSVRALESSPTLSPGHHSTSIFLYPPYRFQRVDALLTNFHLPKSTLLMLVCAFCSYPNTKEEFTTFSSSLLGRAYAEAIKDKYRFFSFGDAMLIL